ncbi:MAG: hypothetical protein ACHREM_14380 [Polyangiales bacterium]
MTNRSEKRWTFDSNAQHLELEGHGPSSPAFVSASPGDAPPVLTIEARTVRVIDLFFVLPGDLQGAEVLPGFDASWSVNAGELVVADRTPFESLSLEPSHEYAVYDYGPGYYWGPNYWYNPGWVGFRFGGPVVLGRHFIGGPVVIHRPPARARLGGGRHR